MPVGPGAVDVVGFFGGKLLIAGFHIKRGSEFAGLLLSIAILPLLRVTEHWWESNLNRLGVALTFGVVTVTYYFFTSGADRVD